MYKLQIRKMSFDSLKEKYAMPLLIYLLEKDGPVNKIDIREKVVKPVSTLDKLLNKLKEEGLIEIKEQFLGRRVYLISLTDLGKIVAKQLKQVSEFKEKFSEFNEKIKNISALTHVNAIDDHIVLKEYNYDLKGNNRLVTIYIQINHDKVMRLWCDVDNSYDCWHVKYAWTLPEVLEWAQYHLQKGDIKDIENNSGDNEVGGD